MIPREQLSRAEYRKKVETRAKKKTNKLWQPCLIGCRKVNRQSDKSINEENIIICIPPKSVKFQFF